MAFFETSYRGNAHYAPLINLNDDLSAIQMVFDTGAAYSGKNDGDELSKGRQFRWMIQDSRGISFIWRRTTEPKGSSVLGY